jgi:hypothetical protein
MQAGEPDSLLMQNFWQTLSRSVQVFASAGAVSASAAMPATPAAAIPCNNLRMPFSRPDR